MAAPKPECAAQGDRCLWALPEVAARTDFVPATSPASFYTPMLHSEKPGGYGMPAGSAEADPAAGGVSARMGGESHGRENKVPAYINSARHYAGGAVPPRPVRLAELMQGAGRLASARQTYTARKFCRFCGTMALERAPRRKVAREPAPAEQTLRLCRTKGGSFEEIARIRSAPDFDHRLHGGEPDRDLGR